MSFRLRPSAFDTARPLIDRIHPRGWIWQGRQELDGLCCVKNWFEGEGWIAALTPWLDHASGVRETDSHIILDFEKPLECDCAILGRVLPLRWTNGALASFAFVFSGPANAALTDRLLIIDQGERVLAPLSGFRPVDIAGWWCLEGIATEEGVPLPLKPSSFTPGTSSSSTGFDPEGFEAGLDDVSDRIRRATRISPVRYVARLAGCVLGGVARILVWLVIFGLIVSIFAALGGADHPILIRLLAFIAVFLWFFRRSSKLVGPAGEPTQAKGAPGSPVTLSHLFGFIANYLLIFRPSSKLAGPADGKAQAKGAASSPDPIAPPDHRFGFFRRAAGWLFWNSAVASGARDKYSKRLREIEALFERGRVDEALRKGIVLGAPSKKREPKERGWFGDFPLSGPGMRKNLNIRFQLGRVPAFGILTEAGFEGVRDLYRKQAEALAERGDFERAAFIYAELLNDAAAAVRIFERKGDFGTAAKLAQGRRLAPSIFIPLWFKAGEKARALRLAVQYEAFADLLAHVKDGDPFRKELVTAWSARLIETGDILRALELTEKYAELMPDRQAWILRGLDLEPVDVVLLARALRCLPEEHRGRLQALLDKCLTGSGPDQPSARTKLASRLADANFEKAGTHPSYFATALPLWSLAVLRALLHDEAQHGLDKARQDAALALSEASRQFALRVDLRRLARVPVSAAPPLRHIVMGEPATLLPVRDVVCLAGNRLLIAYANGALHLLAPDGRRLWSDHVHNVRGFAPIRGGATILIVRDEIEGPALSLLNIDDRTHKDIGPFDIQAFHTEASEIGWMVFTGGRVCLLDASSLIEAAKKGGGELRHHWTVPVTEPGRLCAFRDHPAQATFLYQRKLGGLVELWTLHKSTLQVECRFILKDHGTPRADVQTYGWAGGSYFRAHANDGAQMETLAMPTLPYSFAAERRLVAEKAPWLLPSQSISAGNFGTDTILWCSKKPAAKPASVPSSGLEKTARGVTWFAAPASSPQNLFTVEFPDAGWVKAHIRADWAVTAAFDDLGRIIAIDLQRSRCLFRNDEK